MDYLIADCYVIPPEHARQGYTERMVYLPHTYQVSYYDRHMGPLLLLLQQQQSQITKRLWREELRVANQLPRTIEDGVVFCNFNKQDKLEPDVFLLWMSVLRRVPKSVLWLLQPSRGAASNLTMVNLRREAESYGVSGDRLVFAGRVEKPHHLARHAAADLFLDTLYYGAHSTATDALRGGLPVLTLPGDAFPRRVGASLLNNMATTSLPLGLIVASIRDYEDIAVHLATSGPGRNVLASMTDEVRRQVWGEISSGVATLPPLFNTEGLTRDMERAFQVMWEVHTATIGNHTGDSGSSSSHVQDKAKPPPPYHLVIGSESKSK